jgi:hypothetical protein
MTIGSKSPTSAGSEFKRCHAKSDSSPQHDTTFYPHLLSKIFLVMSFTSLCSFVVKNGVQASELPFVVSIITVSGVCFRYAPGVKRWLDSQVLVAWCKGLQDRCHMHQALKDKQDIIIPALKREYGEVLERHADKKTDSRSETHLKVASLVLATHKVLLPYIRKEIDVIEMLREQNGAKASEGIRCESTFPFAHLLRTVSLLIGK